MEHIGRYQIIKELGKGAMGVVYKATDPNIGRTVAIKTCRLDIHGMEADEMLHRFKNEARAAGVMNHPNIITIYDAGELEGMFYIAMEFIEGQTLFELLKQEKVLAPEKVIDIIRQACAGLDYAHKHGIIHRDIKPANIMMTGDSTVKIMDFGIAKGGGSGMTATGQVVGTPNYMSPEQVKGKPLDGRTDLFSLGVVLYEMITGERPFSGQNVTTIIYKIVNENPPAPRDLDSSVHPGLSAVVMKALAKDVNQRYSSGADLSRDLQNYSSFEAATTAVATAAPPSVPAAAAGAAKPALAPVQLPAVAAAKAAAPKAPHLDSTVAAPPKKIPPAAPAAKKPVPWLVLGALAAAVVLAGAVYTFSHRSSAPVAPPSAGTTATSPSAPPAAPVAGTEEPKVPTPSRGAASAPKPALPIASGDLQISSTPFGAAVTIDGKGNPDWVTPFAARKLKPGRHTVNFTFKGYQPETRQVDVVAGQKLPVIVKMQIATGYLSLGSNPPGAAIYLDGRDTGQVTPARISANEGQHRIALRKEGFKPQITYAEVALGQTFTFAPALESVGGAAAPAAAAQPATSGSTTPQGQGANPFRKLRRLFGKAPGDDGVLEIRTRPKGAEIWLGDAQAPSKTPAKLAVAPGSYKLTLKLPGYKQVIRMIEIEKGKTVGVEEILEAQ